MPLPVNKYPELAVLPYEQLRKHIRSGDLLFASGTTPFAELIKQFTASVWSHIAIILKLEGLDRLMVLESVESLGVRIIPLSNYIVNYNNTQQAYKGKLIVARHNQLTDEQLKDFSTFSINLVGRPYDKEEIIRIMSRITNLNPTAGSTMPRNNEYICSEYVYECFQWVGIELNSNPKGFIAPADIAADIHIEGLFEVVVPTNS